VTTEAQVAPTICVVTGASGFVAQHVIKMLLDAGHTVRGTVRKPDDAKNAFLRSFKGAETRLSLHAAELSDSADHFRPIVDGASFVFHIASPYTMDYKNGQKELVEPAVQGTLAVLNAVVGVDSVRRVVLTSSVAAILDAPKAGHTYSEADWNTTFASGDYYRSKTEAEQAAWAHAKAHHIDLVTINPFMIVGPTYADQHNTSNDLLVSLCDGSTPVVPPLQWGWVDVREVARAHLQAAFIPEASGRYLIASEVLSADKVVDVLRRQFPQYAAKLPTLDLDCKTGAFLTRLSAITEKSKGARAFLRAQALSSKDHPLLLDNSKSVHELHMNYASAEDTITASVKNSVRWGHL
jgi:dihydroflavonol-4-reductase